MPRKNIGEGQWESFEPWQPIDLGSKTDQEVSQVQRFSNTQAGSEPFGEFSTLFYFSTGYKSVDLIRSAWKRFVLIVQPLQFHYIRDDRSNLNRVPLRLGISASRQRCL